MNVSTYNLYNKNKTDKLGEQSEERIDFYIPIEDILVVHIALTTCQEYIEILVKRTIGSVFYPITVAVVIVH